jgi:UDP-N-acetyl-D-galactosamine dehydrogenase
MEKKLAIKLNNLKLAIIGLGYVGLPLAVEFSKKRSVIGFDLKKKRINELKNKIDRNLEISGQELKSAKLLELTFKKNDLKSCNCYIITVPTPINKFNKPDLKPLLLASKTVGENLKLGDIVIYESTVYPGCTEEKCVPILEKFSQLKFNKDFFCGYSPERINPGDKKYNISNIKKITSGSTLKIASLIDKLYKEIIIAGTHKTSSIRIAEAAKVIENIQRDVNIALVNELFILFNKMKLNTNEVLEAAGSKWNFLPFRPGLVGGHCIGVDPYYLTYKAKKIGYSPKIILSGRRINDKMATYVASQFVKLIKQKGKAIKKNRILVMGLTFKENCLDLRNSGAAKICAELKKYKCNIDIYDPIANKDEIKKIFNIKPVTKLNQKFYDGILILVAHDKFKKMGIKYISSFGKKNCFIYDLKHVFKKNNIIYCNNLDY